ncbi:MAG: hypothetical protein M1822_006121 [Bathelium mastoideum]|nr:MAG: hypothetical protein M1822_006121 [Bathelium mastoideum]
MLNLSALILALAVVGQTQTTQYLGRVDPTTNQLVWPGTGLEFDFTGTQAVINFSEVTGTNSLTMVIDNGTQMVTSNLGSNSLSTPVLPQGNHNVVLRKRSESYFGTLTFQNVTTTGTLNTVSAPARRIEFIGDSITVGYGEDGTYPCTNTAAVEDAPNTYGALTAGNFSADYSLIAWSGKGLTRNYVAVPPDTTALMPELWTEWNPLDNVNNTYTFPSSKIPQAVVINLGTNDYSYVLTNSSGATYAARPVLNNVTYEQAYVKFVQTVQSHYPQANFFLTSSPLLSDTYPTAADMQHTNQANAIKAAIAQLNSTKVHFVDFPPQPGTEDTIGCDYHPGPAEHQAMAAILIPAIQSVLGW